MKRLDDYTREELINITDEERELLIEVEAMCEGVDIPEEPKYLEEQFVDRPDMEVYEVEVGDLIYTSKEEAEKVVSFLNSTSRGGLDYKYENGYDRKYYKPTDTLISAKSVRAYSYEKYKQIGELLKTNKKAKEINENLKSDYTNAIKGYNNIKAEVQQAIDNAVYAQQTEERYKTAYNRYIELANGDKEVAQKFFRNTYGSLDEDVIEAVFNGGESDMRGEE